MVSTSNVSSLGICQVFSGVKKIMERMELATHYIPSYKTTEIDAKISEIVVRSLPEEILRLVREK